MSKRNRFKTFEEMSYEFDGRDINASELNYLHQILDYVQNELRPIDKLNAEVNLVATDVQDGEEFYTLTIDFPEDSGRAEFKLKANEDGNWMSLKDRWINLDLFNYDPQEIHRLLLAGMMGYDISDTDLDHALQQLKATVPELFENPEGSDDPRELGEGE